jgi:nitronate monooxygenase
MNLAKLLGTKWPLIQAPMAGSQGTELAQAVSAAGALGSLPGALLDAASLHQQLQAMQDSGTGSYNVNFFCHVPPSISPEQNARWLNALAPAYQRFGLTASTDLPAPGRFPFSATLVEVLAQFRPRVLSFHFGLPAPQVLKLLRSWGAVILSTATTVQEARWLQAQGVDAIIAQGLEAGGHRGSFLHPDPVAALADQAPLATLLPAILKEVTCPVIAAGGLHDAASVAAAMRLGAKGVQVGTAYLLCREAQTSALHRAALQDPHLNSTGEITNLFTGRPARSLVNGLMRELGALHPDVPAFPLASSAIAPLRAMAEQQGSHDFTPLWAGGNVRHCHAQDAHTLTEELVTGFSLL